MSRHGHILHRSQRPAPGDGIGEDALGERLIARDAPLPTPRTVPGEGRVVATGATRANRRLVDLSQPSPLLMRVSPRKMTLTPSGRGARVRVREARTALAGPERLELASHVAAEARVAAAAPVLTRVTRPPDAPRRGMRAARPALGGSDAS